MFHFGGLNKHISSAEVTNIPTEGNNRCEHGVQVNNEVIDNGIKVRLSIYSQMEANQTFLMLSCCLRPTIQPVFCSTVSHRRVVTP